MLTSAVLVLAATISADPTEVTSSDKIRAAMEFLVGEWTVDGDADGNTFTATFHVKWASGKNCLIMTLTGDTEDATAISGRDPSTNELVETLYLADGTRIENRYSRITENVWEGTADVREPSGKTGKQEIRLEKSTTGFTFTAKTETRTLVLKNRRIVK